MQTNDLRRLELLYDAGFAEPKGQLGALAHEVQSLGLTRLGQVHSADECVALKDVVAPRLGQLPTAQARMAALVPEWLTRRSGDLATALWLARAEHGARLDVPGFLLAIFHAFLAEGQVEAALSYARFVLDLKLDWEDIYSDPRTAHAFLRERDPNPLVWKVLEELAHLQALRVVELGCGVGNDALGMLSSRRVTAYSGIDLAAQALAVFRGRVNVGEVGGEPKLIHGDVFEALARADWAHQGRWNLVYSYSSLHYFPSGELRRLLELVRGLLLGNSPGPGYFAFGMKAAGSVWEGQGLPLYRPDVWVNRDGQTRWFPSRRALARLLDEVGFEIHFHDLHDHWGYSETGRRDVFHYVLCSPRSGFIGEGI